MDLDLDSDSTLPETRNPEILEPAAGYIAIAADHGFTEVHNQCRSLLPRGGRRRRRAGAGASMHSTVS